MAVIEWKGISWKAAHGDLSVPELLTTLKGFGPMEVLEFEKPGCFRGQMSLCLTEEGRKEISLYSLEVLGKLRTGIGRAALQQMRRIFKGDIYVEDPDIAHVVSAPEPSLFFWVRMFREGLVDAVDWEEVSLEPGMSESEVAEIEEELKSSMVKNEDVACK